MAARLWKQHEEEEHARVLALKEAVTVLAEVAEASNPAKHPLYETAQQWLEAQLRDQISFSDDMVSTSEIFTCQVVCDGFMVLYHTFSSMDDKEECLGITTRRLGELEPYFSAYAMYACDDLMDQLTVLSTVRASFYEERPIDELCEQFEVEAARIRNAVAGRRMPVRIDKAVDAMSSVRVAWMVATFRAACRVEKRRTFWVSNFAVG